MNERLEIEGDMREDVQAERERIEGYEACPVEPETDETVEAYAEEYAEREDMPIIYFSTCYGCGYPMLDGEEYHKEFCSAKCYCETSCIDREDG